MIRTPTGHAARRCPTARNILAALLVLVSGCGSQVSIRDSASATATGSVAATPATSATDQLERDRQQHLDLEATLASIPDDTTPLRQRLQDQFEVRFFWDDRDEGKVHVAQLGFQKSLADAHLVALAGLPGPLDITLTHTAISDDGLVLLARMRTHQRQGRPLLAEVYELHLNRTRVSDRGLTHLAVFPTLRVLDLSDTRITDAGLVHLGQLTQLQRLFLARTSVNGSGLAQLETLSALRELDLEGTPLDDDGLQRLPAWPQLRKLVLRRTRVSDAGLERLRVLPALEDLDLTDTRITDACVATIKELKRLRRLRIADNKGLTETGAIQLRIALPNHVGIE